MGRSARSCARRRPGRPVRPRYQPCTARRATPHAGLPKLQAIIGDADEFLELLALAAVVVTPTTTVKLARDPDDDRLIEAALAGEAEAIVTGDQDLLTLQRVARHAS